MCDVVRILIADDHPVVRAGLRALLARQPRFRVIAEAADGKEAIAKARQYKPNVAILDVRMPGMSGIEACRQIVATVVGCRVIMLTAYVEDELVFAVFQAGASDYMLKSAGSNNLLHAIERVSHDEGFDQTTLKQVVVAVQEERDKQKTTAFATLSAQELMILALMKEGMRNREIADQLHLSQGTVRNYVSGILRKLNVQGRVEAVTYAVQHGINDFLART
jgi:DNA-binding NarL/FixJ family response regulator